MNGNDYHLDRLLALRERYAHLGSDDLADLDENRPLAIVPAPPACSTCGDPLVITDSGRVCRQCWLEGRVA